MPKVAKKVARANASKDAIRKKPKAKVQAAFEFITSYGWAILILAVILILLYYFIGVPNSAAPNQCSFSFGANCRGLIVTSYNSLTSLTFVITNSQQSPLLNPTMKVATDSYGNASASCEPANILVPSGSYVVCKLDLASYVQPGTPLTGTMYLNSTICPNGVIANCQPEQVQVYKGTFISRATTQQYLIALTSTTITTLTSTTTSTSSTTSVSSTTTSTTSSSSTSSTSTSTTTSGPPTTIAYLPTEYCKSFYLSPVGIDYIVFHGGMTAKVTGTCCSAGVTIHSSGNGPITILCP